MAQRFTATNTGACSLACHVILGHDVCLFAVHVSAELVVDKALDLDCIGGVYGGNTKATPFMCLLLKMLQIQPDKDIVIEFIKNEEFK